MSNLPPNPYTSATGAPPLNAFPGQQMLNHSQAPINQPGYTGLKQDANSNSPLHAPTPPAQISTMPGPHNMNNYHQSANSSPAFNRPGIMPPASTLPPSMLPPMKPMQSPATIPSQYSNSPLPPIAPLATSSPRPGSNINLSSPYPPNVPPQGKQINDNAPPLTSSSQAFTQPFVNGPPSSGPPPLPLPPDSASPLYPPSSRAFISQTGGIPPTSASNMASSGYNNQSYGPPGMSKPPQTTSQSNIPFSGPPLSGLSRSSPIVTGPPVIGPMLPLPRPTGVNGPPVSASMLPSGPPLSQPNSVIGPPPRPGMGPLNGPISVPPSSMASMGPPMTVPSSGLPPRNIPPSCQPYISPPRNGPQGPGLQMGPPLGPPTNRPQQGLGLQMGAPSVPMGPPMNGPQQGLGFQTGPPLGPLAGPVGPPTNTRTIGPPTGPQSLPPAGPQMGPSIGPPSGLQNAPPMNAQGGTSGRPPMPPMGLQSGPTSLPPAGPQGSMGPQSFPPQQPGLQSGPQSSPQVSRQMPLGGPLPPQMCNMQSRYPAMPQPQSNYNQNAQIGQPRPYPQQQYTQGLTQQMGNLSVTKQGFDQLWGHQNIDLLQCRHILPEYPEDPPEIRLGTQFADSSNCSPEIFRCTVNRIPDTNSLLQKSRLPLGILIHPFKDLNHLPVIQCASIVRCRACRTYINPFVYFLDSKRWKCNLCYRVNDLPEEFQYDPVSKSYGDPSRRPEIKSATIEFIAPAEYMLRPPQPAIYLFLMDVSQLARESGYLEVFCKTLKASLDQLPGDARTQVGFVCYDTHVHYYLMSDGLTRPKEMTVLDIDDMFLPSPESLLVNLKERRELISELLNVLPTRYSTPGVPASALGAALQAAYKLMSPTGGRITVFQTCLPNVGPGALQPREDPNARSSKDVAHLNPATDFYKRLALDCSGAQIAVDLFLLNSQYSDLATLSGMSKFSAGSVHHIPLFSASRSWQAAQFRNMLTRYLSRKIGFEAVMRVRATRGISIHTFHGNFFVRSTDLLSLPNVSPDAGFGMQLTIDESLSDLQQVCFQAALLYTSSKGERRIRVHTLALPIASTLPDVLHSADQQCIIGLLSKMAVDRCATASMSEAREALINVAVDALSAHRLAQNLPAGSTMGSSLHAPASLRLLPLYLLATLKRKAFRVGTSTRLDDRVADMCNMKTLPLSQLLRAIYPDLYPVHNLEAHDAAADEDDTGPDPPRLQLSAERINSTGAYLLDDGETMIIYVCHAVSPAFLSDTFGVTSFNQLPDEARSLPRIESDGNQLLHLFIDKLNDDRPYPSNILLLRDNSTSRQQFTERLVDDRVESAFSYYEFLQHIKSQVK